MTRWGTISQILTLIEKWIGQYNITYAYVSAYKLVEFSELQLEKYTDNDLLECMHNKAQIIQVVREPTKMFKGPGGKNLAAILIQKLWKGYKAHSNFR